MTFWELLALVSVMAAILGVFLTLFALINNKTLRAESRNTQEIIEAESRNTQEIIKAESRSVREILGRIDQGQNEMRREMAEARREMAEARREMAEAITFLGQLIVLESEKTRQAIKS
jgi:predicted amino acid-binding ACT domain protein